jgi:Saxitoxin biosynthesis operon protein SxtJ
MILDDIRDLKTGPRELRKFGLLVGGVFALLGLVAWMRGKPFFPYLLVPGAALLAFGLVFPRGLKPVYLPWMTLAILLGFVVSNVLLTFFFFLVMTPIGLTARLLGRDFLRLKLDPKAGTYWIPRERPAPKSPSDYEQQF